MLKEVKGEVIRATHHFLSLFPLSSIFARVTRALSPAKRSSSSLQEELQTGGVSRHPLCTTLFFVYSSNPFSSPGASYGASGVWVGTRFVASVEAGAPKRHKDLVLSAGYDDIIKTLIYSGRPMAVRKTPYVLEW